MSSVASSHSRELFSPELIAKYDRSGPRYTSYPTAAQFHDYTVADYERAARASNVAGAELSLYVHIPFCATVCFYCGCNKVITKNRAHAVTYLEGLAQEIRMQAALYDGQRRVRQMHWGGGTPTFLDATQIAHLMGLLKDNFRCEVGPDSEYSIEIDPRACAPGTLGQLRELGFNRVSFGVQDFDPDVQVAVNRIQSQAVTLGAIEEARNAGFGSVSLDLIYGLPRQTRASFARTLAEVIAIRPERLSIFNYAHMPHLFKSQNRIDASTLPPPAEKLAILHHTIDVLTEAGYQYIGMDHFALPHDELARAQRAGTLHRNFQGYSTHAGCDLVGLGVSSIGMLEGSYHQNRKALPDYYAALEGGQLCVTRGVVLDDDDRLRRHVIMRLVCAQDLDIAATEARFGISFKDYFADELTALAAMVEDGLVEIEPAVIRVREAGRMFLRQICMCFDRYVNRVDHTHRYSRAI
ncbi:MAG: oxygen-independent coproporphyrinogen III oxidase [Gammaproteobacteria bacterium]|nr:oxygen-independent coproporphyrinogen III oxidase [Gammaproteobacteria bacterium]